MKLSPKAVMGGVGVYFAAAVGGYLYLRSTKAPAPSPCGCGVAHGGGGSSSSSSSSGGKADGKETFDRIADMYDSCINIDETLMGIKLMRRWLMRQAQGDVLEVSAGTGRNLAYYDLSHLRSLTLTDTSRPMLINAADKYRGMAPPQGAAPVRFELADAQHLTAAAATSSSGGSSSSGSDGQGAAAAAAAPQEQQHAAAGSEGDATPVQAALPRPALKEAATFAPGSFDVVVDTFGLCSQQDPVTALKEMARVCKPGGRILLLQHGKGTWNFINNILDNGAGEHFRKWGCWWNRDIEKLVRQAGLQIDSISRWHFGTTYMVVARPPADGS